MNIRVNPLKGPNSTSYKNHLRLEVFPPPRVKPFEPTQHVQFTPFKSSTSRDFQIVQTPDCKYLKDLRKWQKISNKQLEELKDEAIDKGYPASRITVDQGVMASEADGDDDISMTPYDPRSIIIKLEPGKKSMILKNLPCKFGYRSSLINYVMKKPPKALGLTNAHLKLISSNANSITAQFYGISEAVNNRANLPATNEFAINRYLSTSTSSSSFSSGTSNSACSSLSRSQSGSTMTIKCKADDPPYVPEPNAITQYDYESYIGSKSPTRSQICTLRLNDQGLPLTPGKDVTSARKRRKEEDDGFILLSSNSPIRLPQ